MSLISQIKAARDQRQAIMPHRDLMETLTLPTSTGTDEWGNPVDPGTLEPVIGAALPCLAIRLSSEDAVRAGLGDLRDVWRVVCNYPNAVSASQNLRITREGGEVLQLAVRKITGTDITVAEGIRT